MNCEGRYLICVMAIVSLILTACGLSDAEERGAAILKDLSTELGMHSDEWQDLVDKSVKELGNVSADFAARLDSISKEAVQASSAEVRCDVDFIGDRVREKVDALRAAILGDDVPALEPQVCSTSPLNIDAARVPDAISHITFGGYNLSDLRKFAVVLVENGGARRDITRYLNNPNAYTLTVTFGKTGAALRAADTRMMLSFDGEDRYSVGITQPLAPKCIAKIERFIPGAKTFIPNEHNQGDREFNGHGPRVGASATLQATHIAAPNGRNHVAIRVAMHAHETESDWTDVRGEETYSVHDFPPGYRIVRRVSPAESVSFVSYVDNDEDPDWEYPGKGPAASFQITGDTQGSDIGKTGMVVRFDAIEYEIQQVGDCAP